MTHSYSKSNKSNNQDIKYQSLRSHSTINTLTINTFKSIKRNDILATQSNHGIRNLILKIMPSSISIPFSLLYNKMKRCNKLK